MKIVKNIDSHSIEIPYEGTTYVFEMGKAVKIPEALYDFIEERFPLSFNFGLQLKNEKTEEVETYKTKIYTPDSIYNSEIDMKANVVSKPVSTFTPDETPPSGTTDRDGVAWYGEGVELDSAN